jgi:hypothetical protein
MNENGAEGCFRAVFFALYVFLVIPAKAGIQRRSSPFASACEGQ